MDERRASHKDKHAAVRSIKSSRPDEGDEGGLYKSCMIRDDDESKLGCVEIAFSRLKEVPGWKVGLGQRKIADETRRGLARGNCHSESYVTEGITKLIV